MSRENLAAVGMILAATFWGGLLLYQLAIGKVQLSTRDTGFVFYSVGAAWCFVILCLAFFYAKRLHVKFPAMHSLWEKFTMFFAPLNSKTPDGEFGRQLAYSRTFFRINAAGFFVIIWFTLLILPFTPWFRP
jgi:hypothetical protein